MSTSHWNTDNIKKTARKPPPGSAASRSTIIGRVSESSFGDISDSHFLAIETTPPNFFHTPPPSSITTSFNAPGLSTMGPLAPRDAHQPLHRLARMGMNTSRSTLASHPSMNASLAATTTSPEDQQVEISTTTATQVDIVILKAANTNNTEKEQWKQKTTLPWRAML